MRGISDRVLSKPRVGAWARTTKMAALERCRRDLSIHASLGLCTFLVVKTIRLEIRYCAKQCTMNAVQAAPIAIAPHGPVCMCVCSSYLTVISTHLHPAYPVSVPIHLDPVHQGARRRVDLKSLVILNMSRANIVIIEDKNTSIRHILQEAVTRGIAEPLYPPREYSILNSFLMFPAAEYQV